MGNYGYEYTHFFKDNMSFQDAEELWVHMYIYFKRVVQGKKNFQNGEELWLRIHPFFMSKRMSKTSNMDAAYSSTIQIQKIKFSNLSK